MFLTLQQLRSIRVECKNPKCPRLLRVGAPGFCVPGSELTNCCLHCGNEFARKTVDKMLTDAGHTSPVNAAGGKGGKVKGKGEGKTGGTGPK